MSKHTAARLSLSDLLAEASDFSRHAWRAAWLPILLLTIAHTILFVAGHVAPTDWRPGAAPILAGLMMIFYVPLFGSLYRTALGPHAAKGKGFGGLQWNGVEWRLIIVGAVIAAMIVLALIPTLAICGIVALLRLDRHVIELGPLGAVSYFAIASAVVWLIFFVVMAPRIARLMLGWAYSIARGKTEPFAGLGPARLSGWPIAWGLILAWVPLLLGELAVFALTLVEAGAIEPGAWPLPEAAGSGALLGFIHTAVVAPLSVGVATGAYWLLSEHEDAAAHHAVRAHDLAALPAEPVAPVAAAEADAHDHAAEVAAAAAAAALAAREASELDLPPSEIDHGLSGHAPEPAEPATAAEACPLPGASPAEAADHTPAPAEAHTAVEPDAKAPAEPHHESHHGLEAALAIAAAAAAAAAAAHAAHEHAQAEQAEHAAEIQHTAEAEHETAAAAVAPPLAAAAVDDPHAAPEALSPWPHSVLPPWPTRVAAAAAAQKSGAAPLAVTPVAQPAAPLTPAEALQGEAFPALASAAEPAHRFAETTELG